MSKSPIIKNASSKKNIQGLSRNIKSIRFVKNENNL